MQKKYDAVHRYENLKELSNFNFSEINKYKKKIEELYKKDEKSGERA